MPHAASDADAATLLQPQAPVLPSAPGGSASPDAATVLSRAVGHQNDALADEPLADDEEYEDEPDDLMAEEAATVLTAAPQPPPPPAPEPAAPAFSATDSVDWSTPAAASNDHEGIVALPPWARKGPDAEAEPAADAAPEAPGEEPVPWWERNGQQSPTAAAKPEAARYVPPPAVAPPASASLESTLARQAMRPKSPAAVAVGDPRCAARVGRQPQPDAGHRRRPGRRGRDRDARHVEAGLREPAHGGERAADRTGRRTGTRRAPRRARARHAGRGAGARRPARLSGSAAARA